MRNMTSLKKFKIQTSFGMLSEVFITEPEQLLLKICVQVLLNLSL